MELSKSGQSNSIFYYARMETIIPLFAGVLCSLVLCAVISHFYFEGIFKSLPNPGVVELIEHDEDEGNFLLLPMEDILDPVLEYYRNPEYTDWVIDFFNSICPNPKIVTAILDYTDKYDVSPSLAFALSWEESRFNPRAVNPHNRDGSIDRGLFQLNNRSFPNLDISTLFDIEANTRHGIQHLRYCLDTGGSEVSALAIYNAGAGRVRTTGAPEVTLNYISRILNNKGRIESRFLSRIIKEEEIRRIAQAALEEDEETQPVLIRTLITSPQ
jgi:hypothetical protein